MSPHCARSWFLAHLKKTSNLDWTLNTKLKELIRNWSQNKNFWYLKQTAFPIWQDQACLFSPFCFFSPCFLLLGPGEMMLLLAFPIHLKRKPFRLLDLSLETLIQLWQTWPFSLPESHFPFVSNVTPSYTCTPPDRSHWVKPPQPGSPVPCFDFSPS